MSIERNLSVSSFRKGLAQFSDVDVGEIIIENFLRAGLPE